MSHRFHRYIDDKLRFFEVLLKVYFQDTSKQYQPLFTTKQSSQDCHQYKKNNLWYLWYLCDKFKKRLFDIVASEQGAEPSFVCATHKC